MSTMRWIGSQIDHVQNCAVSYASQAFSAVIRFLGLPLFVREMDRSSDRVFVVCGVCFPATLEQIIRQERDNLVMKLNSVVQRYSRQVAT